MLLAFDGALPQRDRLLDPELAGAIIGRSLVDDESAVDECSIRRVKYRIGTSLRVLYEARLGDRRETVSVRAFPRGEGERAFRGVVGRPRSVVSRATNVMDLGFDREHEALMFRYPADRKICGPAELEGNPQLLSSFVGARVARLARRAYAPEKSATFAIEDAGAQAIGYVKTYSSADAMRSFRTHRRVAIHAAEVGIRVPAVLGFVDQVHAVVLESVRGRHMSMSGSDATADAEALGGALARLHRMRPSSNRFRRVAVPALRNVTRLIAMVRPEQRRLLDEVAAALERRVPSGASDVCLHGDVHPKNVVVHAAGVALLDFDQSAAGPAAADIGSFLAGIRYGAQLGLIGRESAGRMEDGFLRGYSRESCLPPGPAVRWYTAAAMVVERAMRAVNRVRRDGLEHLEPILESALSLS